MATIKEIAQACNVSIATVSNILNNTGRVGEDTKRRVLEIVEQMNYVPNEVAKNLKRRNARTIGIITEDLTVFNTPEIVDGIDQRLEEQGYTFLLGNMRFHRKYGDKFYQRDDYWASVEDEIAVMRAKQAEGIIYICAHSRDLGSWMGDFGLPTVLAYGFIENEKIPSVIFHDEQAARLAVQELLRSGEKRIAVLCGERESIHTRERLLGFQKALYEAGLLYDPSLIYYTDWSRKSGYSGAGKIIEENVHAIFAMNDDIAAGVYDYAAEHELTIGRDLSVTGIGSYVSGFLRPALTTVEIPLYEIGKRAADMMIEQLGGENKNMASAEKLACRLIAGQSICDI